MLAQRRKVFPNLFIVFILSTSALSKEVPEKTLEQKLIEKNKQISDRIDIIAHDIDLAIARKKFVDDKNISSLTVRTDFNYAEGGVFSVAPHLDLRLHLPNVEKKWQLKFTTSDNEEEYRGINRNRLRTSIRQDNYGGAVGLLRTLGNVKVEFQPRVEFRYPLLLSYLLNVSTSVPGSFFTLHPNLQFFAKADQGVGEFVSLSLDIPIWQSLLFSLINEEQYVDRDNIFSTNHGVRLSTEIGPRIVQGISLLYESSSRPNFHLDRYTVAIPFFHRLYKNMLHYTLMPYLAFPRYLDFKGSPGINLEISLIF